MSRYRNHRWFSPSVSRDARVLSIWVWGGPNPMKIKPITNHQSVTNHRRVHPILACLHLFLALTDASRVKPPATGSTTHGQSDSSRRCNDIRSLNRRSFFGAHPLLPPHERRAEDREGEGDRAASMKFTLPIPQGTCSQTRTASVKRTSFLYPGRSFCRKLSWSKTNSLSRRRISRPGGTSRSRSATRLTCFRV